MSDAIHDWVLDLIDAIGVPGVALVMLIENVFPPIPSELVLPLAGYSVYLGDMALVAAIFAATVGSTLGAMLLYGVGRYGGMPLVLRYHGVLRITEVQIARADAWFDARGDKIVFFARMVPLARSAVSVPAGMANMPIMRFVALTFAGSAIWNTMLIGLGYGLGSEWEKVTDVMSVVSKFVVGGMVIGLIVYVVLRRRRRAAVTTTST